MVRPNAQNSSSPVRAKQKRTHVIPGSTMKARNIHQLRAVARYLKSEGSIVVNGKPKNPKHIQHILDGAKLLNGKALRLKVRSSHSLANSLKAHPDFGNNPDGYRKGRWFLRDANSYLLGEGEVK